MVLVILTKNVLNIWILKVFMFHLCWLHIQTTFRSFPAFSLVSLRWKLRACVGTQRGVCGCTMWGPVGAHLPNICQVRCCDRQHSLSSPEAWLSQVNWRQLSSFVIPSLVDLKQSWGSSVKAEFCLHSCLQQQHDKQQLVAPSHPPTLGMTRMCSCLPCFLI